MKTQQESTIEIEGSTNDLTEHIRIPIMPPWGCRIHKNRSEVPPMPFRESTEHDWSPWNTLEPTRTLSYLVKTQRNNQYIPHRSKTPHNKQGSITTPSHHLKPVGSHKNSSRLARTHKTQSHQCLKKNNLKPYYEQQSWSNTPELVKKKKIHPNCQNLLRSSRTNCNLQGSVPPNPTKCHQNQPSGIIRLL